MKGVGVRKTVWGSPGPLIQANPGLRTRGGPAASPFGRWGVLLEPCRGLFCRDEVEGERVGVESRDQILTGR